jgi:hypothetical protein
MAAAHLEPFKRWGVESMKHGESNLVACLLHHLHMLLVEIPCPTPRVRESPNLNPKQIAQDTL